MPNVASVFCRWFIAADLPVVLGIERETFGDWTDADFRHELQCRNVIGYVAECGETLLGFMVTETTAIEIQVLNFAAIYPEARACLKASLAYKAAMEGRTVAWNQAGV